MNEYNRVISIQRLVFSLVVVIMHGHHFTQNDVYCFLGGAIAVEYFFLLSGGMLAGQIERQIDLRNPGKTTILYIRCRIIKMLPSICTAWFIGIVLNALSLKSITLLLRKVVLSTGEFLLIDQTGFLEARFNDVTWYISAMLLISMIMFYFGISRKDFFFNFLTPLTFLFLYGYTYQTWEEISNLEWNGLCFNTIIRGLMDMSAGCICYKIAKSFQKYRFRYWIKICTSVFSWALIIIVLLCTLFHKLNKWGWYYLLILMVSLVFTLTNQGVDQEMISIAFSKKVSDFSFALYLGHGPWRYFLKDFFPAYWKYHEKLLVYIFISTLTALFIMRVSEYIKKKFYRKKESIRLLFFE